MIHTRGSEDLEEILVLAGGAEDGGPVGGDLAAGLLHQLVQVLLLHRRGLISKWSLLIEWLAPPITHQSARESLFTTVGTLARMRTYVDGEMGISQDQSSQGDGELLLLNSRHVLKRGHCLRFHLEQGVSVVPP